MPRPNPVHVATFSILILSSDNRLRGGLPRPCLEPAFASAYRNLQPQPLLQSTLIDRYSQVRIDNRCSASADVVNGSHEFTPLADGLRSGRVDHELDKWLTSSV